MAAVLASLLVTWVTFVPSFLFVLLGAPYVERLRGNRTLSAALTGITAAVVGVIANLGVYFAVHTLFAESGRARWGPVGLELPDVTTVRPLAVALTVVAAVLLFRVRLSVLTTLGVCACSAWSPASPGCPSADPVRQGWCRNPRRRPDADVEPPVGIEPTTFSLRDRIF